MIAQVQKAVKNPHKLLRFLQHEIGTLFGHWEYKKFILLARKRTGSNFLLSCLNSHSNIYAKGEILARLNGQDHKKILQTLFSKQPQSIKAAGFKIFYRHPYGDYTGQVWQTLLSMPDLHVIHLKRRNALRTIVSQKIAMKTRVWEAKNSQTHLNIDQRRVTIPIDELERKLNDIRTLEVEFDDKFSAHPRLIVYYEELVNDLEQQMQSITNFLSLPFYKPTTPNRRQNPESLSNLVENYDELWSHFSKTKWHDLFEDAG
ncbi:MAG: sulfotransferase [Anaerolineae bacterium]|nr:sulfotransferase [Anaerolineae bacterium]